MQSKRSECGRRRFGSGARVVDRDERRARRGARYPDPPRSPGRAVAQRRATDEQFTIRGYRKRAPRREISPGCRWCPRRSTASRATSVPTDGDPRATRCTYVTSSRVTRNPTTDPEANPGRARSRTTLSLTDEKRLTGVFDSTLFPRRSQGARPVEGAARGQASGNPPPRKRHPSEPRGRGDETHRA